MSGLEVRYEDLPGAGLVFVPSSADRYAALVKEIEARSLETAARYPGQAGLDPHGLAGWKPPDHRYSSVLGLTWWSIVPGSKRYIANGSAVIGDNARRGTLARRGFGGGGVFEPRQAVRLAISIIGAFFDNGDFAGTNRSTLFEQITAKAKARS